jgi:hypothetical protein
MSAPAGTTATPNTTILSAAYNAFVADLIADLNAARPVTAGGTGGTSVITGWDGLAAKGTDIASGSSINLTTATGPSVTITGTATIASVTLAEGSFRIVRAGGAFTWDASSSLLVNGSSTTDVTAAANDLFLVRGGASSVVSVVGLGSATTAAATTSAAGIVELATATETQTGTDADRAVTPAGVYAVTGPRATASPSDVASVLFTGLSTSVRAWRLEIINLRPATDNDILMVKASASGTPVSTGYFSFINRNDYNSSGSTNQNSTTYFISGGTVGNDTNEGVDATLNLHGLGQATHTAVSGTGTIYKDATLRGLVIGGRLVDTTAYTELSIAFLGGNITSGEIRLYANQD